MRDDLQVNNIAQRQVYHYLKDCDFDGHLETVIDVYRRRRDVMAEAVRASFPEGTRVILPGGGLFIKKSELARLGLRRQRMGVIEPYGSD